MNRREAREILVLWRPGREGESDPEMAEALACAERDPELMAWFVGHRRFQSDVTFALRSITPPAEALDRVLAEAKVSRPIFGGPRWLRMAVAAVVVIGSILLGWWMKPETSASFATYRSRMVRSVIREYRMDVTTNDLAAIRRFMSDHQAPSGFRLAPGLARLPAMGGGLLGWQGGRVSMVCLDGGRLGTVFLFVTPRSAFAGDAPEIVTLEPVSRLMTASWSQGGETYLCAVAGSEEDLRAMVSDEPPPR